jgi:hypothetical protein
MIALTATTTLAYGMGGKGGRGDVGVVPCAMDVLEGAWGARSG